MKLTTKLMLLFLLLATIPMAALGYLAYNRGRQAVVQNVFAHLLSTNALKEAEFNRWIEGDERLLRELARRPLVKEFTAVLTTHDPADPLYQTAYVSLIEDHLVPSLEERGVFLDLSILQGDDGLILISTTKSLEGKYKGNEPFFLEGRNRTFVQRVSYSMSHEEVVMHIGTPILDREGNLIAVLSGHADLTEMSSIMEQGSGLSQTQDTYLVNTFNFFVSEPRFGDGFALKKAAHTEGVETCLQGQDGVSYYEDYRGVPVIGAYTWMPERELCILTEVDVAEVYAPIVALRNSIMGFGAIVVLGVAVLAVVVARSITKPISHLVKGAEEIGRGHLNYRIEMKTSDEIGLLGRAFDQMAENLSAITASRDELNQETTERKRAEEALKDHLARLEEMVEERTQELQDAQEQLVRRERLAVLGQLAGGVGHELRNPLGVIGNAVYYLKAVQPDADEMVKEYLDIISFQVRNSEKIVADLLDFARIKSSDRYLVAVAEMVDRSLAERPSPSNVDATIEVAADLPPVFVDPRQIEQVLVNLLSNAYQAMPAGGKLLVSGQQLTTSGDDGSEESPEVGNWILITVKDTGCGISEENMDKLFEPLFTTKARGIGLGLATSKTLVEANAGRIRVESVEGSGSTFTVWLPMDRKAIKEVEL